MTLNKYYFNKKKNRQKNQFLIKTLYCKEREKYVANRNRTNIKQKILLCSIYLLEEKFGVFFIFSNYF